LQNSTQIKTCGSKKNDQCGVSSSFVPVERLMGGITKNIPRGRGKTNMKQNTKKKRWLGGPVVWSETGKKKTKNKNRKKTKKKIKQGDEKNSGFTGSRKAPFRAK